MDNIPENVKQTLNELLPLSVASETVCFVFFDEHPRDEFNLDITVCSQNGLVQEFYQRQLINSILLENSSITEIKILRNSKCDLFYLVSAENEIILISRKEDLKIHYKISNVEAYNIEDSQCRGYASLNIIIKDDAVPLVFDDNFDKLGERILNMDVPKSEESLPIINQLRRKLNEVKYTTTNNENKLQKYLTLRQMAAFSMYQRTQANLETTVFNLNFSEISNILQIKTQSPIVKCCNKKLLIISSITNKNVVPLTAICVLLHGTTKQSIAYTTKVFESLPEPPYWKEKNSQIDINKESTVVAVVDLKEINDNVSSRINFNIVISYIKEGKSYLLPLESVNISPLETMDENFDMLYDKEIDCRILLLSILATSQNTNLCLRHIQNSPKDIITPQEIFSKFLKMETLGVDNIAIHKASPYHMLYGILVVFPEITNYNHITNVEIYSRNHSQVLALIHYMYDKVPYRLIATTQDCKITALTKDLLTYNENLEETNIKLVYKDYAMSFVKQTTAIKEYFDNCMIAMSVSKDAETKNKIGFEVDLLAQGHQKFLDFRNLLLSESLNGIKSMSFKESISDDVQDLTMSDDM